MNCVQIESRKSCPILFGKTFLLPVGMMSEKLLRRSPAYLSLVRLYAHPGLFREYCTYLAQGAQVHDELAAQAVQRRTNRGII